MSQLVVPVKENDQEKERKNVPGVSNKKNESKKVLNQDVWMEAF
jgi:hypothetical protein